MDGPHDLGGKHGFGALDIEENEPVFHHDWEARCFAMNMLLGSWRKWNIDMSRHALERLAPAHYLSHGYYERWTDKLTMLACETGLISENEAKNLRPDPGAAKQTPPVGAGDVRRIMHRGRPASRDINAAPVFAVGDAVQTIVKHTAQHTRLPAYARGRQGEIVLHHGAHVLPDRHAHGGGEAPEHLYAVCFTAQSLWGEEANPGDAVTLDLWESYLRPV